MIDYTLCRIVAGDLPPRDQPGGRLRVLRFILRHEPPLSAARKLWVVNYIHHAGQREETIGELRRAGVDHAVLSFDAECYRQATDRRQRLCRALNVNGARNAALDLMLRKPSAGATRFMLPLDGECFFTADAWNEFRDEVERDQARQPGRQYYSLPMFRAACDRAAIGAADVATMTPEEPQIAFRHDAAARFDESLPWGQRTKLALLRQLGHVQGPGPSEYHPRRRCCRAAGYVFHLATCAEQTDGHLHSRAVLREKAATRLLAKLAERHR